MEVDRIWRKMRGVVPVRLYPVIAPVYRWNRRRAIYRLDAEDAQYRREHPHMVVPGADLRFNVAGAVDIPGFLAGGKRTAEDIESALKRVGASMETFTAGLDFGCGCGRFLLEAVPRWPAIHWYGSDVDPRAVHWCAENISGAAVTENAPLPPLRFSDAQFEIIWCGSVFTHLDEQRQDAWLAELTRVLSPGGYLLASVHGPFCWEGLPPRVSAQIKRRGFLFARTAADKGIHPDWYQTAWHTPDYVQDHWSKFLPIAAYIPAGLNGYQDVVVARRPL